MVGQAVGDVRGQRGEQPVDHGRRCPGGPMTRSGRGREGRDPAAGDHVVEVGDVVAVEVGEHERGELVGGDRRPPPPASATPRPQSNRKRGAAGADEGGRPGALRVDERAAGAEQRDLDHGHGSVISTATMQPASAQAALLRCRMLARRTPRSRWSRRPAWPGSASCSGSATEEPIDADFTGWSKLVLLTARPRRALPARPHPGRAAAARGRRPARRSSRSACRASPVVRDVFEDPGHLRLPGGGARSPARASRSTSWWRTLPVAELARPVRRARSSRRRLARASTPPRADPPPPRRASTTALAARRRARARRPTRPRAAADALARARALEPVLVHGDLHEGQLLVDPEPPHRLTGILDWQTARVDHPFVEFDLGEWGTALWRGHRADFPELRRRAWDAYAGARGLPDDLGAGVRVAPRLRPRPQACSASTPSPSRTAPDVVGTVAEARTRSSRRRPRRRLLTARRNSCGRKDVGGSH